MSPLALPLIRQRGICVIALRVYYTLVSLILHLHNIGLKIDTPYKNYVRLCTFR